MAGTTFRVKVYEVVEGRELLVEDETVTTLRQGETAAQSMLNAFSWAFGGIQVVPASRDLPRGAGSYATPDAPSSADQVQ